MKNQTSWPPVSVRQRVVELKDLRDTVRGTSAADSHAPYLDRYLVIRSAGLVETVRDDVAVMHAKIVSPTRAHRRITKSLMKGLGASPDKLIDFVHSFDMDWAEELREWFESDDAQRKNNMATLVAARNKISHGDGHQVNSGQALTWSETALEVAAWLIKKFDPR